MKTAFVISEIIRPAIVKAYGEDRAVQIERHCNGALNDVSDPTKKYVGTVKVEQAGVRWNGQIAGGHQITAKGKLAVKEATWSETEKIKYSVEQSTAPVEFVKFHGGLVALYKKSGSRPSGTLTIDVVPAYCRQWFDAMHVKAKATGKASKEIEKNAKAERANRASKANKPTPAPAPATPAPAPENGAPVGK